MTDACKITEYVLLLRASIRSTSGHVAKLLFPASRPIRIWCQVCSASKPLHSDTSN